MQLVYVDILCHYVPPIGREEPVTHTIESDLRRAGLTGYGAAGMVFP